MSGEGTSERLAAVRRRIAAACTEAGRDPTSVTLVAVSKRHPVSAIRTALADGQTVFGENRVQELAKKSAELGGEPLQWHMVGNVQTNKVKQLLCCEKLSLIHSLDRLSLAKALHRVCAEEGRTVDCLVEVNSGADPRKHGVALDDAAALVAEVEERAPTVCIRGLMTMGPLVDEGFLDRARAAFTATAALGESLRGEGFARATFDVLSLGMTADLEVAIAAGATMVRIGTAVFGSRPAA